MSPEAEVEVALALEPLERAVLRAEQRSAQLPCSSTGTPSLNDLQDLRTDVMGDLVDALDFVSNGLGTRLHLALYPGADALVRGGQLGRRLL